MSLGIALKGPEGIVLAADSRVTLMAQIQMPNQPHPILLPATFDNATKLLRIKGHDHVAAVTYGQGAIGLQQPRTAHSFLPEFERELGPQRIAVEEFANRLGGFFMRQWTTSNMPVTGNADQDMIFLVGGYSENEAYGEVYEVHVPSNPTAQRKIPVGEFGMIWGGQRSITDRIVQGFDGAAMPAIYDALSIPQQQRNPIALEAALKGNLMLKIPIQFLPLQDCVDFAIFIIRATILLQKWIVDVRGVGGSVDVATITRVDGFTAVQLKQVVGEQVK
jgi:hypothetical protein